MVSVSALIKSLADHTGDGEVPSGGGTFDDWAITKTRNVQSVLKTSEIDQGESRHIITKEVARW